jgi:hypothetical protein
MYMSKIYTAPCVISIHTYVTDFAKIVTIKYVDDYKIGDRYATQVNRSYMETKTIQDNTFSH